MKNRGLLTVISAIAIQLTLGIAYIWSVFQTGIANSIYGGNNAAAGLTFSLLLAALSIGGMIGGKLAVRYSTRLVVFAGGLIISAGFFLASFVKPEYSWLLWITYGIMGGVGMGFTYSTTIACAQKWYPHKKGLVTGIIVSALGFGGVIFTPVVVRLIAGFGGEGVGELDTFKVLSIFFLLICSAGSIFLVNPPDNTPAAGSLAAITTLKEFTPKEALKTLKLWLIILTFLLACMGGLMMIGFAKPIAVAKGLEASAAIGVLAITMFNSLGRLIWGMASDRLGRINTIILLLAGGCALSLLVNAVSGYWVFVLTGAIGFFYGGLLSNFPSLTADLFGAKHMATIYGFVLLGFGGGAILSSQIAGHYKNIADNSADINLLFPAFLIASACSAIGIILMLILKKITKKA